MSIYQNSPPIARPFDIVRSSFLQDDGQHFAQALPEERIAKVFAEEGADFANDEEHVFTPAVTLWAWLSQVLNKGEHRSCLAAVSRVALLLVATCLLAYNLIRKAMLEAARANHLLPRTLSFAAAKQTIATSFELLVFQDRAKTACVIAAQIASLADQRVGHRPHRVEPCAVKRRPNPIALLTKPRKEARAELLNKHAMTV